MSTHKITNVPGVDEGKKSIQKSHPEKTEQKPEKASPFTHIRGLQQQVGNRAVQRFLRGGQHPQRAASNSANAPTEVDEETASRINRERSGGQPLPENTQAQLESNLGQDFSGVRMHTGPAADQLNRDLSAKAFTIGSDIFFREGAQQDQRTVAHEAAHVVQQSAGEVSSPAGMVVNPPGDVYEQEADRVAETVLRTPSEAEGKSLQLHGAEDEGTLQRQEEEEEEPLRRQQEDEIQLQAEEEPLQRQEDEEEEIFLQQEVEEEEEKSE